jgi:O6-methylguanine-DNA--protein-cysteine methyltransferase
MAAHVAILDAVRAELVEAGPEAELVDEADVADAVGGEPISIVVPVHRAVSVLGA